MLILNAPRLLAWLPGVVVRTGASSLHLTFDDGPSVQTTPHVLDALAAAGQTATFFLLAEAAALHPALVRRIVDEGHDVGAHGTVHTDYWRRPGRAVPEMAEACARLKALAGIPIRYVRPPYGHLTPALWRWARRTGRRVGLWSEMPGDFYAKATSDGVAITVQKRARPGSVVVLHDGPATAAVTPDAVARLLAGPLRSTRLP